MEQLLFNYEQTAQVQPQPSPVPQTPTPKAKDKTSKKPTLPVELATFDFSKLPIGVLCRIAKSDRILIDKNRYYMSAYTAQRDYLEYVDGDKRYNHDPHILTFIKETDIKYFCNLAYFDDSGNLWMTVIQMDVVGELDRYDHSMSKIVAGNNSVSLQQAEPWKVVNRLPSKYSLFQPAEIVENIAETINPYGVKWCRDTNFPIDIYLMAPQVELLTKAGFKVTESLEEKVRGWDNGWIEKFNRLCKKGNNPKEIFKTPKSVFTALKDEKDISIWDCFRRMEKFGKLSKDSIEQAYSLNLKEKDIDNIASILGRKYEEKPVFTWETLVNYMNRIAQYEAIEMEDGLMLLKDYLTMCNALKIKPITDSDSLKREHDVTARTLREKDDENLSSNMKVACDEASKYNYSENIYFVRSIRDYADLRDEAIQQRSCVACYAKSIARKKSMIFVMREVSSPDKSLITIELSPDGKIIRQKLLARNQKIRNKAQSDFIDRWHKWVKTL